MKRPGNLRPPLQRTDSIVKLIGISDLYKKEEDILSDSKPQYFSSVVSQANSGNAIDVSNSDTTETISPTESKEKLCATNESLMLLYDLIQRKYECKTDEELGEYLKNSMEPIWDDISKKFDEKIVTNIKISLLVLFYLENYEGSPLNEKKDCKDSLLNKNDQIDPYEFTGFFSRLFKLDKTPRITWLKDKCLSKNDFLSYTEIIQKNVHIYRDEKGNPTLYIDTLEGGILQCGTGIAIKLHIQYGTAGVISRALEINMSTGEQAAVKLLPIKDLLNVFCEHLEYLPDNDAKNKCVKSFARYIIKKETKALPKELEGIFSYSQISQLTGLKQNVNDGLAKILNYILGLNTNISDKDLDRLYANIHTLNDVLQDLASKRIAAIQPLKQFLGDEGVEVIKWYIDYADVFLGEKLRGKLFSLLISYITGEISVESFTDSFYESVKKSTSTTKHEFDKKKKSLIVQLKKNENGLIEEDLKKKFAEVRKIYNSSLLSKTRSDELFKMKALFDDLTTSADSIPHSSISSSGSSSQSSTSSSNSSNPSNNQPILTSLTTSLTAPVVTPPVSVDTLKTALGSEGKDIIKNLREFLEKLKNKGDQNECAILFTEYLRGDTTIAVISGDKLLKGQSEICEILKKFSTVDGTIKPEFKTALTPSLNLDKNSESYGNLAYCRILRLDRILFPELDNQPMPRVIIIGQEETEESFTTTTTKPVRPLPIPPLRKGSVSSQNPTLSSQVSNSNSAGIAERATPEIIKRLRDLLGDNGIQVITSFAERLNKSGKDSFIQIRNAKLFVPYLTGEISSEHKQLNPLLATAIAIDLMKDMNQSEGKNKGYIRDDLKTIFNELLQPNTDKNFVENIIQLDKFLQNDNSQSAPLLSQRVENS